MSDATDRDRWRARLAARLRSASSARTPSSPIAQQLRTYECDGLAHYRVDPGAGRAAADDRRRWPAVVRACADAGVPFVARGSGTGLSGGALPHADGVLIVTVADARRSSRSTRSTSAPSSSPASSTCSVTRAAAPHGYYYAPDPSSQQICSIGGNVAENSGGAHCLKYGFTTNHVTGLEVVTPDGEVGPARRQGARTRRATTCSARSSARRARSASPPR